MERTRSQRTAGFAAAAAMVVTGVAAAGAARQVVESPPDDGAALTATVTVTRALLTDTGEVVRELPTSRYTLAQYPDHRLRLTMLASGGGPRSGPLADPYAGLVVEGDLARGALELRSADGRRLPAPIGDGFTATPAAAEAFLADASRSRERRDALERTYGRPAGRLRGLVRYVTRRGAALEEVLVSPDTQLPAELSLVADGVLTEHHTFSYLSVPGRGWVRQRSTSQTRVPGARPQRLLSITMLDDIRTSGGAR